MPRTRMSNNTMDMTRIIFTVVLLATTIYSNAQVKFTFAGGIENPTMKSSMESDISKLLTEMNDAQEADRTLNLNGINMSSRAKVRLTSLWNSLHLKCEVKDNIQECIENSTGLEVRRIPVEVIPRDSTCQGALHKELTIRLSKDGTISGVNLSLDNQTFQNLMKEGITDSDINRRRDILDTVEIICSYYNEKNLAALNDFFQDSESVVMIGKMETSVKGSHPKNSAENQEFTYTRQGIEQYITRLKKIFMRSRCIHTDITDIQLTRYMTRENFYKFRMRLTLTTEHYIDDSYILFVWECRDEKNPVIHIKGWIPYSPNLKEDDLEAFFDI